MNVYRFRSDYLGDGNGFEMEYNSHTCNGTQIRNTELDCKLP